MDLINFSVCLTDLPKDKITKSEKNGKQYISLTAQPNKNGVDKFGNDFNLSVSQTKEERAAKENKVFVGNGKSFTFGGQQQQHTSPQPAAPTQKAASPFSDDDDLPF